ncbi:hypothetical protein ACIBW9_39600 [Streptomyces sp. NPDC049541]|uniref:hypothetical protein n=1 Tax=Streptomyces sp. NPDC049541 TaxID=3365594 RepID=UPI0037A7AD10
MCVRTGAWWLADPRRNSSSPATCATSGGRQHLFTDPLLLVVALDGIPLDRGGARLVLPQDRCGARCISRIDAIRVDGGHTAGLTATGGPAP